VGGRKKRVVATRREICLWGGLCTQTFGQGLYIVVVKVRLVMKGDKRFSEKAIVRSHRIKVRDQAPSHRVNEKYDVLGQKRYR